MSALGSFNACTDNHAADREEQVCSNRLGQAELGEFKIVRLLKKGEHSKVFL